MFKQKIIAKISFLYETREPSVHHWFPWVVNNIIPPSVWREQWYIPIRFVDFSNDKMRIYSPRDFLFIFFLIYNDFHWIYWKIKGWNLLFSSENGISTSFCVKKWYFHCPREKGLTEVWCGNAPYEKQYRKEAIN